MDNVPQAVNHFEAINQSIADTITAVTDAEDFLNSLHDITQNEASGVAVNTQAVLVSALEGAKEQCEIIINALGTITG